MYCEITHFSAVVCPDIVITNLDVFRAIWSQAASDVVSRFFPIFLLFSRFFSVINGFSGSPQAMPRGHHLLVRENPETP